MAYLRFLLAVCLTASSVLAIETRDAATCCSTIAEALPEAVYMPSTALYEETNDRYYIRPQADMDPTCRVLPATAEEVSQIVKIAAENKCQFAVASGKHWALEGGSNIGSEGFTMDLLYLNGTSMSDDGKIASVGPALRAGEVFDYFNQFDVYVAVGRDSDVGVGGFLVGGGMSFPSFEHGLGSNTVANFEVVLASGEIVNANETSHPDLFWAIKAGSTNYGIVTRFDMIAYPAPLMWAGFQSFSMDDADGIMGNYADAIKRLSDNPSDAGVMVVTFNETSEDFIITEGFYRDGEEYPPLWDILVGDGGYEPNLNTVGVKTFPEFLEEIKLPSTAQKTIWKTYTLQPDGNFAVEMWKKGQELFADLAATADIQGLTYDFSVHPMLKSMRCATFPGPACDVEQGDLMLFLARGFWDSVEGDAGDAELKAVMAAWDEWINEEGTSRGLLTDYRYLDYIGNPEDSPYTELPAATLQRMLDVQAEYDSNGVFATLWKGGFKLPAN